MTGDQVDCCDDAFLDACTAVIELALPRVDSPAAVAVVRGVCAGLGLPHWMTPPSPPPTPASEVASSGLAFTPTHTDKGAPQADWGAWLQNVASPSSSAAPGVVGACSLNRPERIETIGQLAPPKPNPSALIRTSRYLRLLERIGDTNPLWYFGTVGLQLSEFGLPGTQQALRRLLGRAMEDVTEVAEIPEEEAVEEGKDDGPREPAAEPIGENDEASWSQAAEERAAIDEEGVDEESVPEETGAGGADHPEATSGPRYLEELEYRPVWEPTAPGHGEENALPCPLLRKHPSHDRDITTSNTPEHRHLFAEPDVIRVRPGHPPPLRSPSPPARRDPQAFLARMPRSLVGAIPPPRPEIASLTTTGGPSGILPPAPNGSLFPFADSSKKS